MQNNVNITTSEKSINVIYGILNNVPEREQARTSLKYILSDLNDIRKQYIRLGFHLAEFERNKYYEDFGFTSLYEFCDVNLGLDKSSISRCISVFKEFSKKNNDISQSRTMFLDDKYCQFSYSQLCEMVSMSDDQRRFVKPEMTIKQIRELKKSKNVSQDVSPVATSQQEIKSFDYNKASTLKGAALKNYVKSCDSVKSIRLEIYDKNGDSVSVDSITNTWISLLSTKDGNYILRLWNNRKIKKIIVEYE